MLDGFVYAVPGPMSCHENNSNWRAVPSVERYNPNTNTWQLMESVGPPAPSDSCVVTLDGLIYYIIGMEQSYATAPVFQCAVIVQANCG